jgi:hypothetical protein
VWRKVIESKERFPSPAANNADIHVPSGQLEHSITQPPGCRIRQITPGAAGGSMRTCAKLAGVAGFNSFASSFSSALVRPAITPLRTRPFRIVYHRC